MKYIILLLCWCFFTTAFSQNYNFGKISKEELQEKYNPLDSASAAAYLYKYRRTYIKYRQEEGFSVITEIRERIKIYNKSGFKYANEVVNLHVYDNKEEEVMGVKGYTYNLIKGKVEETKLDKKNVFFVEKSKFNNQAKFTMPNIKEGCIIEFKYSISSPFYWNVDEFVFQHDIPVKNLYATFETPEYFNFKPNPKGFLSVTPVNEVKRGVMRFSGAERSSMSQTKFVASELAFTLNTTSFSLTDVPALRNEPYVNNINNYRSGVKYELSYTDFPNSPLKYFTTTWENVVKTIYDNRYFGKELKKTRYFQNDIDNLTNGISEPMAKAMAIYNYVKSKIKWNGYYGKFTNKGVERAYLSKEGNVAEINLMLTSMLRYAGINANPVLISARKNGIPLYPTIKGYNYVVSTIETPKGNILLDATNINGLPNMLPVRALNWKGRIVRNDRSSSTVNLYPSKKSISSVNMLANLTKTGELEGNVRYIKTSYRAMELRREIYNTNEDLFVEKLENKLGGLEITDFGLKNAKNIAKPIMESFKFSVESQTDIINDRMYFSPLFFLKQQKNLFKLEKREFPVDFKYPSTNKYAVIINIPEGYEIESIPESNGLLLPDNLGSYKYSITASGNKIQLNIVTDMNQPIITPNYYDALKAYFSKLIEKEGEQIVLIKK